MKNFKFLIGIKMVIWGAKLASLGIRIAAKSKKKKVTMYPIGGIVKPDGNEVVLNPFDSEYVAPIERHCQNTRRATREQLYAAIPKIKIDTLKCDDAGLKVLERKLRELNKPIDKSN